jgi:transcription elongation factor Elf1
MNDSIMTQFTKIEKSKKQKAKKKKKKKRKENCLLCNLLKVFHSILVSYVMLDGVSKTVSQNTITITR